MKLRTPVTGTEIVVADESAPVYLAQGFQRVDEPKETAPRKRAPKKKEK